MFNLQYILFFIVLLLAIVFAVLFIVRSNIVDAKSLVLKAIASICFILITCTTFYFGAGLFASMLVLAGQVFGIIGDLFLDMKYLYRKDERIHTYTGFIAFLIGHLFFIAFMTITYGTNTKIILISLAVAIVAALLIYFVSEKLAGLLYKEYKLISTIYMFVLAFTMMYAILQIFMNNTGFFVTTKILFAIGLVFFMLSDLVLAMIYFTPEDKMNTPLMVRVNLSLYYIAQICISVSLLFILM